MATGICVLCGKTRGTTQKPWSLVRIDGKDLPAHETCARSFNIGKRTAQAVTNEAGELLGTPDHFSSRIRRY